MFVALNSLLFLLLTKKLKKVKNLFLKKLVWRHLQNYFCLLILLKIKIIYPFFNVTFL